MKTLSPLVFEKCDCEERGRVLRHEVRGYFWGWLFLRVPYKQGCDSRMGKWLGNGIVF